MKKGRLWFLGVSLFSSSLSFGAIQSLDIVAKVTAVTPKTIRVTVSDQHLELNREIAIKQNPENAKVKVGDDFLLRIDPNKLRKPSNAGLQQ
jgi:hypothetical protein